jgi:oligopeptide transport system substrate-binding protein
MAFIRNTLLRSRRVFRLFRAVSRTLNAPSTHFFNGDGTGADINKASGFPRIPSLSAARTDGEKNRFRNSTRQNSFQSSGTFLPCLGIVLCAAALSGCGRIDSPADLVILNGAEPESLDPAIITGQPDMRVVRSLFEGLTRLDPVTARPEPGLAERWERSPDGMVYLFYLRSNLVWSTGEPITAQDVVYSWRRVLDPLTASDYAAQLFSVKHAEEFFTGKIKEPDLIGVHALDPLTVQIELDAPTPYFLDLCALPALMVVSQRAIEKHGDRWLLSYPVPSSGPYQLEAWRIHDKIRVRLNPFYWDHRETSCERVDFLPIESPTTALNLYETGQADVIWDKNLIPSELMDILRRRPDCHTFDYLGVFFYRYNVTKPPFDDVRVRQALALAVDKRRIVERITRGGERVADHFTPDGLAHYHPPAGLGHDPGQARALLAAAGYPQGHGFPTFQYLFKSGKIDEEIGVELQAMWKNELGVTMELRQTEWKVYLAAQTSLEYDISRSSWIGDYADPNTFLEVFTSDNGNNRTGWKNRRYDQLLRDGNRQTDPLKREKLLREAETILVREELPMDPIYFYAGVGFFDTNRIDGIYFNSLDVHPVQAIRKKP